MSKERRPFHGRKHHAAVGQWLAHHPDVKSSKLNTGHERGFRYRYGHLVVTWYHTGSVLVQGNGVGNLVFKQANCKSCQGKPKIIQALNWMVAQVERRAALGAKKAGRRGTTDPIKKDRALYHKDLDRRIRERRKQLES
jgi:hypothetical protein